MGRLGKEVASLRGEGGQVIAAEEEPRDGSALSVTPQAGVN